MNTKENGLSDYLKSKIAEKNISMYEVYRRLGGDHQQRGGSLSYKQVQYLIKGKQKNPRHETLKLLSRALGEPYSDLLKAAGYITDHEAEKLKSIPSIDISNTLKTRKIPILNTVQASHFEEVIPHGLDEDTEYIHTASKDPETFAVRVQGDCMEPEFREGDIITISPNSVVNNGDYVIAMRPGDAEATFKQYKKYGDQVVLHPLNPKYDDIIVRSEVNIIGRVISKTKAY